MDIVQGCLGALYVRSDFTGSLPLLKHVLSYNPKKEEVFVRGLRRPQDAATILKSKPHFKNVIVDIGADECLSFMTTVYNAGLMSGYYHYHFTSLVWEDDSSHSINQQILVCIDKVSAARTWLR